MLHKPKKYISKFNNTDTTTMFKAHEILGMAAHTWNHSTKEAEAEGSSV